MKSCLESFSATPRSEEHRDHQMQIDGRQFTYAQLAKVTDTFVRIIDRRGFGIDYYGELENGTQVVVKLWLQSSPQGDTEFLAEVITQFFLGLWISRLKLLLIIVLWSLVGLNEM